MAHLIAQNEQGAYLMASTGAEWHHSETGHAILPHAATQEDYDQWKQMSGLDARMEKTPVYQKIGEDFFEVVDSFLVRREHDYKTFGVVTQQYQIFQPGECIDFLREFVGVDERFQLNTAGTLKNGAVVWANFGFSEDINVLGEHHKMNLLATTTFDGTGATRMQGRMIRTVCNNTLQAGEYGAKGVSVGHRTTWTPAVKEQAKRQLEEVLKSHKQYAAMAEAMAGIRMSKDQAISLLRSLIFSPKLETMELADGSKAEVWSKPSTRAANLMDKLEAAYMATVNEEGTKAKTSAWTTLNAITRYADHDMGVKKGNRDEANARMESQIIGAASMFKSKGIETLIKSLESFNQKEVLALAAA